MVTITRKCLCIFLIMLLIIPSAIFVYAEDAADTEQIADTEQNTDVQNEQPVTEEGQAEAAAQEPDPQSFNDSGDVTEPESVPDPAEVPYEDSRETLDDIVQADETIDKEQTEAEEEETALLKKLNAEPEAADTDEIAYASESRNSKAKTEKSVTIEGTKLDGSSSGSGNGWTYDKDNNTVVLNGFNNKADIITDGTGITIVTTGLNSIGTLSCDGQIDVIGSGVLLIDKIELAEGCDFNLHSLKEFYGEDGGSTAVFLRQADNSYLLINGSVTGLIDEEITLPAGTTLVLPENSNLKLTALDIGITYEEDGTPVYRYQDAEHHLPEWESSYKCTDLVSCCGILTVDNLILEENSSITILHSLYKGMEIVKNLVNNGTIKADIYVSQGKYGGVVNVDGKYSGSGVIDDAIISINKAQEMSINLRNAVIYLKGSCVVDNISSSGSSRLCYDDDTIIRNISMSSGSRLNIYSIRNLKGCRKLRLTGAVTGGEVCFCSGLIDLEEQLKVLNGAKFSFADGFAKGASVFDYIGTDTVSLGTDEPVFFGPDDFTVPDQTNVPAVAFNFQQHRHIGEHRSYIESSHRLLEPFDVSKTETEGIISYEDLELQYAESEPFGISPDSFEVIRYVDGKLSMSILSETGTCPSDNIVLIRVVVINTETRDSIGGTSSTTTLTSRTGSAAIGGNSNIIMTGTGITRKSSESDKQQTEKTDTSSDKTAHRRLTAGKASPKPTADREDSDVLALQINEFDLNEGTDNKEKATYYILSAYLNGGMITELDSPVEVTMDYALDEEFRDKPLYAVFINEEEDPEELLSAVNAYYDEEAGTIVFETSQLGEFVIAALEFEGEEFSPEFYDELKKAAAVQPLMEILKERSE